MQIKWLIPLLPLFSFAQTWPTKDCPDRPYIKGNDGVIYHTCDCAIKIQNDSAIYFSIDTAKNYFSVSGSFRTIPKPIIKRKPPVRHVYSPVNDVTYYAVSGVMEGTKMTNRINHYDSLICPQCGRIVPRAHVKIRIELGLVWDKLNEKSLFPLTPLGEYDMKYTDWRRNPDSLPPKLFSYLPKDYKQNMNTYLAKLKII